MTISVPIKNVIDTQSFHRNGRIVFPSLSKLLVVLFPFYMGIRGNNETCIFSVIFKITKIYDNTIHEPVFLSSSFLFLCILTIFRM